MAKKIIPVPSALYSTTCQNCGTHFSYEVEDILRNPGDTLPRKYVTCASQTCGAMCTHSDFV